MRIGILGGSFDPVHNAHLMVAHTAIQAGALGQVLFLPAGLPPHKGLHTWADAQHRMAMVRLAITGEPRFVPNDYELHLNRPAYTAQTLQALLAQYPQHELTFILGADSLMNLLSWYQPQSILRLVRLIAVYRPGWDTAALTRHADELTRRYGARILLAPCKGMDISSTQIRERVRRGEPIDTLTPPAVAQYIHRHGLYRGEPTPC